MGLNAAIASNFAILKFSKCHISFNHVIREPNGSRLISDNNVVNKFKTTRGKIVSYLKKANSSFTTRVMKMLLQTNDSFTASIGIKINGIIILLNRLNFI